MSRWKKVTEQTGFDRGVRTHGSMIFEHKHEYATNRRRLVAIAQRSDVAGTRYARLNN
jgi:hypothetical protein